MTITRHYTRAYCISRARCRAARSVRTVTGVRVRQGSISAAGRLVPSRHYDARGGVSIFFGLPSQMTMGNSGHQHP
jgi:hypothetical protein